MLSLDSTNKGACWVLMGVRRNGFEGVKRERTMRRVDVRREKTRGRNQFLFFCCALPIVLPSISAVQEIETEKDRREDAMKWVIEKEKRENGGGRKGKVRRRKGVFVRLCTAGGHGM